MIYGCIRARSREGLGRAINPHLFRDCVATSIAIDDPHHVHVASRLLGHRKMSTTEQHYNLARSVEASRLLQNVVLALRRGDQAPCSQVDHR
jgi:integrase